MIDDGVNHDLTNPQTNPVSGDLLKLQNDTSEYKPLWRMFADQIPAEQRRQVVAFAVLSDGPDAFLASVNLTPDGSTTWILAIDPRDADELRSLQRTLVHEFGHVLTLRVGQVPRDEAVLADPEDELACAAAEANCPRFFTGEGGSLPASYLNLFFDAFWADIYDAFRDAGEGELYDTYPDALVTDYAATHPGEDSAKSWTAFVLDPEPAGDTYAEEKILIFTTFPNWYACVPTFWPSCSWRATGRAPRRSRR